MPFFAVENLTQQSAKPCCPWEFVATENITDQIRHDKKARTSWYQNPATRHCFYTTLEGANPNQRPSKENPPAKLHGFAADFDLPITHERAAEVAASMPVKPAYIEKSLGVGTRLVWTFHRPVVVDTCEFCTYLLQRAAQWLSLDLLPGLDAPQFERIGVLLCCGTWKETGYGPISETALQAFLFDVARQYNFTSGSSVNIPLELVEARLRELFPAFNWPGEFTLESQGPSFWLADSTSAKSAIVKANGIFTFSAHSPRSFYGWSDLLGVEFTKDFFESSVAKATADIWFDSKHFWRRGKDGHYINCEKEEIQEHLKVNCSVSAKPDKTGVSLMDQVLCYIRSENRIKGSAPFVFRPAGVIEYMGHKYLNTYSRKPIQPSVEPGEFPTLREWLSKLFHETEIPDEQMLRLLAWWKHAYEGAIHSTPSPGTVLFLMGGVGVGKTFCSRYCIGESLGGFFDACGMLVRHADFNSHRFEVPLWAVDDESVTPNTQTQIDIQQRLKQIVANSDFSYNRKFCVSGMVSWMGRVIITANTDSVSTRILGPMDSSTLSKITILRCADENKFEFPGRQQWPAIVQKELPFLLNWLLTWEPPDFIRRDNRYGYAAWHEASLLDSAYQNSSSGTVKEIIYEALVNYFSLHPDAMQWAGTSTQLLRMLQSHAPTDFRAFRAEYFDRSLALIEREGLLRITSSTGPVRTRIWAIQKPSEL